MSAPFDLLLRGGSAVTPAGVLPLDVGVRNGRIAELGDLSRATAAETFDATGLHLLPGVIDTQVHFREPGLEHKEDIESGSRGALLGGVTAFFEMPNTKPATTTRQALNDKLRRAAGRSWTDYAFFIGATADNAGELPDLERAPGCAGVKIFMGSSTGDLLVETDDDVRRVLRHGVRRVSVHSEDEPRLRERRALVDGGADVARHPDWRDAEAALLCTQRLLRLAHETGRRVHVLHITTADEIELLAEHKDVATVEATPQHLTMSAPSAYERLGSHAQMNPPIRSEAHRLGLWRGVDQGIVDVLGSDHAPHTRDEKAQPYPQSPSGMTGVQTLLPIMLDHVHEGRLTLERLVDLTSAGPARIFGIARKGRIAVGYDADFAVVDLAEKWTITSSWIASKAGWTPYDGWEIHGKPVATVLRGRVAARDGQVVGEPGGQAVKFVETLEPETS